MALWRNRDLEDILGGKLEQGVVTEAGLRKLVEEVRVESEFVEYKSRGEFNKHGKSLEWNAKQERAKDVSAAANGRGAILIYGIEDEAKSDVPDERMKPFQDSSGDRHKLIEQFRKDVRQQTTPTPLFDIFAVEASAGGFYLVVIVPPSSSAPHAVTVQPGQSREYLSYFVRAPGETHIRYLKEHEVAELYGVRARRKEDRAQRTTTVWDEGRDMLLEYRGPRVWLAVAVVPDVPVDECMTPPVRDEIVAWDEQQYFPDSILGHAARTPGRPFPAPGKVAFTGLVEERTSGALLPRALDSYRELHADGSAYAALKLGEPKSTANVPVAIDPDDLIDAIAALITHTLAWTAERAGRWGNATVQIGFVVGENDMGITPPIELTGSGGERTYGLRRTRSGKTEMSLVDLASLNTMQDKLKATYFAALPVLQGFGVVQPAWITQDGAIVEYHVLREKRGIVSAWAERHDVDIDSSIP